MRIYSALDPHALTKRTRDRLSHEGFPMSTIPWVDSPTIEVRGPVPGAPNIGAFDTYHRIDLALYTYDDVHTIRSPHRGQRKRGDYGHEPGRFAATFDQWGIYLGALFDVVKDDVNEYYEKHHTPDKSRAQLYPAFLRVTNDYDHLGKTAARLPHQFFNSREVFTWKTEANYSEVGRREILDRWIDGDVCTQHKWQRTGDVMHCTKCPITFRPR